MRGARETVTSERRFVVPGGLSSRREGVKGAVVRGIHFASCHTSARFSVLFEGELVFVGKQESRKSRTTKALRRLNTAAERSHLGPNGSFISPSRIRFPVKPQESEDHEPQPGDGMRSRLTRIRTDGHEEAAGPCGGHNLV